MIKAFKVKGITIKIEKKGSIYTVLLEKSKKVIELKGQAANVISDLNALNDLSLGTRDKIKLYLMKVLI